MHSKKAYAFFDADGTLLKLRTMFDFENFWLLHYGQSGEQKISIQLFNPDLPAKSTLSREEINIWFYKRYEGRTRRSVLSAIDHWHSNIRKSDQCYYHEKIVLKLENLRSIGIIPVIVSGSSIELLKPFANELNITQVIATKLQTKQGKYTGKILGEPLIGKGKRMAVLSFLKKENVRTVDCHAFGDHISDAPMLQTVGRANIIAGDHRLESLALQNEWNIINISSTS